MQRWQNKQFRESQEKYDRLDDIWFGDTNSDSRRDDEAYGKSLVTGYGWKCFPNGNGRGWHQIIPTCKILWTLVRSTTRCSEHIHTMKIVFLCARHIEKINRSPISTLCHLTYQARQENIPPQLTKPTRKWGSHFRYVSWVYDSLPYTSDGKQASQTLYGFMRITFHVGKRIVI